MKVSSPIGDLPFKPTEIKISEGAVLMEGNMGAWPAHVQIELSDLVDIAFLLRYVLLAVLTALTAIFALRYIRK